MGSSGFALGLALLKSSLPVVFGLAMVFSSDCPEESDFFVMADLLSDFWPKEGVVWILVGSLVIVCVLEGLTGFPICHEKCEQQSVMDRRV